MPCCAPLLALAVLATAAVGLCARDGQLAEALSPGGAPRGLLERAYVCSYVVDATVPHLADAFTQGLTIANGTLYESDGLYGHSQVRSVDRISGWTIASTRMKHHHFAEGIEVVGTKLVQLTWKASVVLEYSLPDLQLLREVPVSIGREGWGLASDGRTLYVTDSGSALYHVNPDTYEVEKRLTARRGRQSLSLCPPAPRPPPTRLAPSRCRSTTRGSGAWGKMERRQRGATSSALLASPCPPHTAACLCARPSPLPPPSLRPTRPPAAHPSTGVNELEWVDGELWGNVYPMYQGTASECVARINAATGEVIGWVDFRGLLARQREEVRRSPHNYVLNGIAYDERTRQLLVTGKKWDKMYEVRLQPRPDLEPTHIEKHCSLGHPSGQRVG